MKLRQVIFVLALVLACLEAPSHSPAQKLPPLPKWPTGQKSAPPPKAPQNNPLSGWGQAIKQKAAQEAVSTLLDNQLPLKLDATAIYPTVPLLPGGPFLPRPLELNAETVNQPLPPGDYVVHALAFCSEYSVHRPGAGVAYEIGPIQGKAAQAISTLLWRGTIERHRPAQQLQAVSWTIQSGVTYSQMPKTYQAVVDDVIPEYKGQISGDFIQSLQDLYQSSAKDAGLPPLERMLGGMGKPGELALSATRQRQALLRQNTSDQIKEQTLFAGQESGVYTPVKAEDGPWTVRIPGVAYVRYRILGGNMASNNEIQIRIMPRAGAVARSLHAPRLVLAEYALSPAPTPVPQNMGGSGSPSVYELSSPAISYSVSRGAQALYLVPAVSGKPPASGSLAGKAGNIQGVVKISHDGVNFTTLQNGDPIYANDIIQTEAGSHFLATFLDNTQLTMSENSKIKVDQYVYDPNTRQGSSSYRLLQGAFVYVSGLMAKKPDPNEKIETVYGCICIRGTEFVARYDAVAAKVEVDLISGMVEIGPDGRTKPFTAPIEIVFDAAGAKTSQLTRSQYDAIKMKVAVGSS